MKVCRRGHPAERRSASGVCRDCAAENARRYRTDNRATIHPRELAAQKKRRAADPEKHIAEVRAWQAANPEKRKATRDKWKQANPDKVRADAASRRGRQRDQLCVDCCDPSDFEAVYKAARLVGGEVDHRIPLALGGLHCCSNLQVLSEEAHAEKSRTDISLIATIRHAARRVAHV